VAREAGDRWRQGDILVRPVRPEDAEDLYLIVSDPAVNQTLLQLPSMEFGESVAWMQSKQEGRHRLVAEVDGHAIGSVGLHGFQNPRLAHSARIGLMVHRAFWNRGAGTALMSAVLDLADNWLNLRRVELDVITGNAVAKHLYEKHGFEVEGTRRAAVFGNGRYLDEHVMARLRGFTSANLALKPQGEQPLPPRSAVRAEVTVRPPRPEDAAAIYDLLRHPEVSRTTLQLPSQEIFRTQERLNAVTPGIYRYVAVADGQVVGHIALHQADRPRLAHGAGLGMMVDPALWGRGIGSRLMEAAIDLADNWLNLKRVELDVNVDNVAGVRLYEKFGFVIEGTRRFHAYGDGRWADSHFMARLRPERSPEQEEYHV
jgi:putative acetyltransferase